MASWVSLNDLYVKTEGESTIDGTLKIVNSNTGTSNGLLVNQPGLTDSFYNVGDEIKSLRDSVSYTAINTNQKWSDIELTAFCVGPIVGVRISRDIKGSSTLIGTQPSPSVVGSIGDYRHAGVWESAVVGVMSDNMPVVMEINPDNGQIVLYRGNAASSSLSQDFSLKGCLVYYRG